MSESIEITDDDGEVLHVMPNTESETIILSMYELSVLLDVSQACELISALTKWVDNQRP